METQSDLPLKETSIPYFKTWGHESLVEFAAMAYVKMNQQADEIMRLGCQLKDVQREYRELILRYADDGR